MRSAWLLLLAAPGLVLLPGCGVSATPELVWGKKGVRDGDLVRPRAAAFDQDDRLYVVDFTARIQVFDRDGKYLGPTWTTPDYRDGRPSGLSTDRDGHLVVCDSHYHCVRVYGRDGTELRKLGGEAGPNPGQFGYISDAVQDADGCWYLSEFGENHRITKLDADGRFVRCWGGEGGEPGQLLRPRALALGPDGLLYVADACNHRVQVFTRDGELVRLFGEVGAEPGRLSYPYDLAFNKAGELYVSEYGNHRVQKFTRDGESLGVWGGPGRDVGQLHGPWGLAVDSRGRVHVLDTENHRVQRIKF